MKDKLNLVLVGADKFNKGFGSRAHIPAIKALEKYYNFYGICTTKESSSKKLKEIHKTEKSYGNIDELVEDKNVDIITIAVRVRHHYDILWKSIKKRKIIYCEWPLCLNSSEASTIMSLAKQLKLKYHVVGTQGRFAPSVNYLKDMLDGGKIGELLFVKSHHMLPRFDVKENHWWSSQEEEHSGALGVASAHCLDTLQHILGNITSLCAQTETLHEEDKYIDTKNKFKWSAKDYVNILFYIKNKIPGSLTVCNLTNSNIGFELLVVGTKGHIKLVMPYYVSYSPGSLYMSLDGIEKKIEIPKTYLKINNIAPSSPGYNISYSLLNLYKCIKENKNVSPNFYDGYLLHKVVENIKLSHIERKWINI